MKPNLQILRETRFRLPSPPERDMALWVDRIGAGSGGRLPPGKLRVLGQFAAVAVESGHGDFFSPAAGPLNLMPGDVVLLFPNEPNRYGANPSWRTHWIVWNGPEAEKLARHGGLSPRQPVVRGAASVVRHAFAGLEPLLQIESFAALLERKRLVLGLVAELLQHLQVDTGSEAPANRIAALVTRLHASTVMACTVPEMAEECHLSVSQFRRLFRQQTGRSPVEFLTARRITQAKQLLAEGVPMKDVATRTGYADVFYFMRAFRRTAGQTVGQFQASGIAQDNDELIALRGSAPTP